jgi:hypothetical protein
MRSNFPYCRRQGPCHAPGTSSVVGIDTLLSQLPLPLPSPPSSPALSLSLACRTHVHAHAHSDPWNSTAGTTLPTGNRNRLHPLPLPHAHKRARAYIHARKQALTHLSTLPTYPRMYTRLHSPTSSWSSVAAMAVLRAASVPSASSRTMRVVVCAPSRAGVLFRHPYSVILISRRCRNHHHRRHHHLIPL